MGRRAMETKLKAQWSFVIIGFLCAVLGLAIFHTIQTYASKDSRVKKEESKEVAGIKNDVPLSREMSEALKRKEIELNEQEQRIKDESERLKIEEAKIKSRIDELLEIQAKLEKSKKEDQKLAEDTKAKLLKTFEKIQPKKAAAIITNMEDDVAVSILKNLKEKTVAGILENLTPDRATALSTQIARRKPVDASSAGPEIGKVPAGQVSP